MTGLRACWADRHPAFGAWKVLGESVGVEVLAASGFDWIGLDAQHGSIAPSALVAMLQAADAAGVPAVVRLAANDPASIGHALDAGAGGVIVPGIESAADATRAVAACRYPPDGRRSWGPLRPAVRSGGANAPVCVALIESPQGIASADEIAAVPGLDGLFLGPTDLGLEYGFGPGLDADDARLRDAVERLRAAADRHGLLLATRCFDPDRVASVVALGFTVLSVLHEVSALAAAGRAALDTARGRESPAPRPTPS